MGVIILIIICWLILSIAINLAKEDSPSSDRTTYRESSSGKSTWTNPRKSRFYVERDYFERDDYLRTKMQQSRSNFCYKTSTSPIPPQENEDKVKETTVVRPPDYDGNSISSLEALLTGDDADVVEEYEEDIMEYVDSGINPEDVPDFNGEQLAS